MKRNMVLVLLLSGFLVLLASCSSDEAQKDSQMESSSTSHDTATTEQENKVETEELANEQSEVVPTNRKIIHRAELQLNVKNLENTQLTIEKKVSEYGGYIVVSNVYRESEESISAQLTVRIPEKHFQKFLTDAEGEAAEVLNRNVTGEDVTEQYIDLESRMKSKRTVEERLLDFMGKAEKTEDLLKISSDLSVVQEEIELIVGKMKYLENQTSFSTIEIAMYENRVIVPGVDSKNLDTWEKTKKQLATSTNFIFAAGSGLIVLFFGNLPVLIFLLLVGIGIYFIVKRTRKPK
ncbi:DUF4349 domain-containing protein [Sporosarcina sp. ANT_H38]|uniref:DUF4349 domain-containing protein n=1 Tax=Sporosarcina sp. ANT_H38 TaxID=2597358 RepID=UPI0011F14F80|nr:DUF4349 domain-containing protein [Sporosarcina sp. ANT_H38]KAA0955863.1 DUF4349 domain-containing protein [Sporosarcina sp. ANT_H38]